MPQFSNILFLSTLFRSHPCALHRANTPPASQWLVDLNKGSGNVEFPTAGHRNALKILEKERHPKGQFTVDGTSFVERFRLI